MSRHGSILYAAPAASDARKTGQSGQASVLLLSILGTFLLASVAFAVDMGNLWFRRQALQSAADAACNAGAMDMLYTSQGTALPRMGFVPGVPGQCSTGVGGSICTYARFNGYGASVGGMDFNTDSKEVLYSFPSSTSVPGVTAAGTSYPFLRVVVEENVETWFMSLLGKRFQLVSASCTCGLTGSNPPPPLVVLNPTAASTLNLNNSGSVIVQGGPQMAVEVNSSSAKAVSFASGADRLDTHLGGPGANFQGNGSHVGVYGNEPDPGTTNFVRGNTGQWIPNSPPAANPFAAVAGPNPLKMSTSPTSSGPLTVAYKTDGCPDTAGCMEFKPGVYTGGITNNYWQTMIFLAGVYYMNGNIEVNSEIRLAKPATWKQTDGIMFYFKSGTLHITNGSGNVGRDSPVPSTALSCDGSDPDLSHGTIPSSLNGNILVGPCTAKGTYWDANGDTTDTAGTVVAPGTRGLVVFQDPSNTYTPGGGNIDGGAALTYAGSLYYHSTQFLTTFSISNAGTSGGLAIGRVIADKIVIVGSGALKLVVLSSGPSGSTKVGAFQ